VISSGSPRRVFAHAGPVDMRKGFDGLFALVQEGLGRNPLSGDMFLFVSRNRIRAKVLLWDGTGLCVYAKRLEKGRFACLWEREEDGVVELSASELQLFLEGCEIVGRQPLSPKKMTQRDFRLAQSLDTIAV
jgi:transposase